jgi:hypothetical protein
MNYTVSQLTTKPDCEALLQIANAEKSDLEYRKAGLQRERQASTLTSYSIQTGLAAVNAEVSALETVLNALPPGPTYDDTQVRITKARYKQFLLEQRKGNYGPISLVEKEYEIACIDQALSETDAFVVSITARMDELPV